MSLSCVYGIIGGLYVCMQELFMYVYVCALAHMEKRLSDKLDKMSDR